MLAASNSSPQVQTSIKPEEALRERTRILKICRQKTTELQRSFPVEHHANELESWRKCKILAKQLVQLFKDIESQSKNIQTKDRLSDVQEQIKVSLTEALRAFRVMYSAAESTQNLSDDMAKITTLVALKSVAQMLDIQLCGFNKAFPADK